MKKLKNYQTPDFEFLELHFKKTICGNVTVVTDSSKGTGDITVDDNETGSTDNSTIFREGIWDEE